MKIWNKGVVMKTRLLILISGLIPGLSMADGVTETAKQVAGAVVDFVIPPAYAAIPEPTTMALVATGIGALLVAKRKKKNDK